MTDVDSLAEGLGTTRLGEADDGVPFRATRRHVHHTWARTFSSLPELYIQPQSVAEIQKVVRLARAGRRRVCVVGSGHSPSDLTCTSSWLVNLDKFDRILSVDEATGLVAMQSGIRLHALCEQLEQRGLTMPNLGSINEQSMAGVFSTGTHGSSLRHGLLSDDVEALELVLADGSVRACSASRDPDLFRAALLSLGALGIITQVTFRAVPAFRLRWTQTIDADAKMLSAWGDRGGGGGELWTQAHFVRVWWFPYTRRAVVWAAKDDVGPEEKEVLPVRSYYDGRLGYYVYHNLLWLAQRVPRILPWVEWFVFGMQYGFRDGTTTSGLQPSRDALLMNCLYSQFVDEWALPLERGPEALSRLSSWLNRLRPGDDGYVAHGIPFSADGLYVHAPVEVRVCDTSSIPGPRPFLDPTAAWTGPTLYLNATLYRPYLADPPCRERYYEAFEWLMRDLGGRPHWAKNFAVRDLDVLYGDDLRRWREIRHAADPEGMFIGPWHRRYLLGAEDVTPRLALEEVETGRAVVDRNGVRVQGEVSG